MAINNISMQYFKMSKVMQNHPRLLNKVHQWWSHADLPWSLKQKEKSLKWILFYPHNLIKSGRTFDQYNQGASTKHLKNALQKGQEDQGDQKARRSNQSPNIHWKDWCWSRSSDNLATWCKEPTHWKRPWCWERRRRGLQRMRWLDKHELGQTLGDAKGQGSLVCPWGLKESDMT